MRLLKKILAYAIVAPIYCFRLIIAIIFVPFSLLACIVEWAFEEIADDNPYFDWRTTVGLFLLIAFGIEE